MKESTRKKTKVLDFEPAYHSVYRSPSGDRIYVEVTDDDEPDRRHVVELSDRTALRLAEQAARLVGFELVQVQVDQSVRWDG